MDREEGLWEAARALWMKYCGVADEYKMLRDRWLYLHDKTSISTLPYIKTTFNKLDRLVDSLNSSFKNLGFKKDRLENKSHTIEKLVTVEDYELANAIYKDIKAKFFDLATYVGLLKLAFFQRNVSSEISHVISGLPQSPERTIGNELFYLAADNLAKSYYKCLKFKNIKWDGFITFAPPKEALDFYGAFFRPSKFLPLFHVSMSEEQKYFVGSYLAIAHEFGHAILHENNTVFYNLRDIVWRNFYHKYKDAISSFRDELPIRGLQLISIHKCEDCNIYPNMFDIRWFELFGELFHDFLSDVIAVHIGGINTIEAYFNEIFLVSAYQTREYKNKIIPYIARMTAIIRLSGIISYLQQAGYDDRYIKSLMDKLNNFIEIGEEILDLIYNITKRRRVKLDWEEWTVLSTVCINCLLEIGKLWGEIIAKYDQQARRETGSSIFSYFIKDAGFFNINSDLEEKIVNSLLDGRLNLDQDDNILNVDPRYIVHSYFKAYKESTGKQRPNYAMTIFSLAFNRYIQKIKI